MIFAPDGAVIQCVIRISSMDFNARGASATLLTCRDGLLSGFCLDRFHVSIGQTEMVADLMDQHVGDEDA